MTTGHSLCPVASRALVSAVVLALVWRAPGQLDAMRLDVLQDEIRDVLFGLSGGEIAGHLRGVCHDLPRDPRESAGRFRINSALSQGPGSVGGRRCRACARPQGHGSMNRVISVVYCRRSVL